MYTQSVNYTVREDALDEAKAAIETFVELVRQHEPGTLFYRAYQDANDPFFFQHFMAFKTTEDLEKHRTSTYCQDFVDVLYPLCELEPEFIELESVAQTPLV